MFGWFGRAQFGPIPGDTRPSHHSDARPPERERRGQEEQAGRQKPAAAPWKRQNCENDAAPEAAKKRKSHRTKVPERPTATPAPPPTPTGPGQEQTQAADDDERPPETRKSATTAPDQGGDGPPAPRTGRKTEPNTKMKPKFAPGARRRPAALTMPPSF